MHLGLIDKGFPHIVPLHYGYEYDATKDIFVFYMHSAKVGHKIELIKEIGNIRTINKPMNRKERRHGV